ncbi:hypothetical protein [Nostoc sp.]|uniref:hypothetical protein n=1 Tax=Nostoc sp. TaxID=1180 RepID=UPI002FF824E3
MNCFKRFISFFIFAATLYGLNRVASAQDIPKYIHLGDYKGEPVFFDTDSVIGSTYKMYVTNRNGLTEMTFQASCNESKLFIINFATYNREGRLLTEDKKIEEVEFNSKSIVGAPMVGVCQRIGVQGL